jgi:hypothetical protein
VHAWDEGVAFYAGSLEGNTYGGTSAGKMVYRLAEKRAANFGTLINGVSQVNHELTKYGGLFDQGRDIVTALEPATCDNARPILAKITELMTVPLIQGALRYAYKLSALSPDKDKSQKNAAEGAVFTAAVLPLVHACDAVAADTVGQAMKMAKITEFITAEPSTLVDFAAVKAALETTYKCLGITCAQVGALQDSNGTPLNEATAACVDLPCCGPARRRALLFGVTSPTCDASC